MKKIFFLFILFVGSVAVTQAQFIEQGAMIGTGSFTLEFTSDPDSEAKSTSFSLDPWLGYFVIDNLAVGGQISFFTSSSQASNASPTFTSTGFGIGPVVRYYIPVGVFFQLNALFGSGSNSSDINFTTTVIGAAAGYAVRIGENAFFEPMIGYTHQSQKYDGDPDAFKDATIFIGGGFTIKIKKGK